MALNQIKVCFDRLRLLGFLLVLTSVGGCAPSNTTVLPSPPPVSAPQATRDPNQPIDLVDITAETGIHFVHTHGGSGEQYIIESITAGMATLDYDGDGLLDLYFVNGAPLRGTKLDYTPRNALYRNVGQWKFVDVTEQAGVGNTSHGVGTTAGDFDEDGDPDLFVTNFGADVLYQNQGDGTFRDVSVEAGVTDGTKVGAGACFFDMDSDGDLDLYSANYIEFSYESHPHRVIGGVPRAPSPLDFTPQRDTLFRNNGDGSFSDVSEESGIARVVGRGMGLIASDYDNDGDVDVFICNDVMANFLLQNDGQGHFENVAPSVGVAYGFWGKANGNMGVDCADFDRDGLLDFVITTYQGEMPVLQRNVGFGLFEDVAIKAGFGAECMPHVKWGVGFADFDNDTNPEIYVTNGHLEENIRVVDDTTDYRVPDTLYLNLGQGRFRDITKTAGTAMAATGSGRGTVFDDLDNDGDIDVVVENAQGPPTVCRNDSHVTAHWLELTLHGTNSNRDAVGARVQVVAGGVTQIDEVHSGRGYQSQYGLRLHFGLGQADKIDRVEIRWPAGQTTSLQNIRVDQHVTVLEGEPLSFAKGR